MARPPIEWPIPAYVAELRERVVVTFRVPARLLAGRVPRPLAPNTAGGEALVSLCLGQGRCVKSVGGAACLASEFHVAELLTPVFWRGACRPLLRGNFVLGLAADAPGLRRLVRTAVGFDPQAAKLGQAAVKERYVCRAELPGRVDAVSVSLPRPLAEAAWPEESVFSSHEAAEVHLLHPQHVFVPDRSGRVIHAAPVHQYARSTTHVVPVEVAAPWVAEALGVRPAEVALDHVFFQKRCTHTWSFPPERILVAAGAPVVRQAHSALGVGWESGSEGEWETGRPRQSPSPPVSHSPIRAGRA